MVDWQICRILALVCRCLVCITHCICIGDGLADQPRINIELADSSRIDTLVLDSNRIGAEWHLIVPLTKWGTKHGLTVDWQWSGYGLAVDWPACVVIVCAKSSSVETNSWSQ